MRTLAEVNNARSCVAAYIAQEGVSREQMAVLTGMLTALVWVAGDEHASTMDRLLAGNLLARRNRNP